MATEKTSSRDKVLIAFMATIISLITGGGSSYLVSETKAKEEQKLVDRVEVLEKNEIITTNELKEIKKTVKNTEIIAVSIYVDLCKRNAKGDPSAIAACEQWGFDYYK